MNLLAILIQGQALHGTRPGAGTHFSNQFPEPRRLNMRSPARSGVSMPILRYFAVVGSVLMALLFYADAELPKTGPIAFGSQVVDLPGAQRAHAPMGSTLVAAMAPAPDMNSSLVRAAEPPAAVQTADAKPSANEAAMVADASPPVPAKTAARTVPVKKKKHVARRAAPRPDRDDFYDTRHYASRGFDNGGGFFGGGGGLFGRF